MFRVTRLGGKWYGMEYESIEDNDDEIENIMIFVQGGNPVILADDLDTLSDEFGIPVDEITIVD